MPMKQSSPASGLEPFELKRETRQREEADVIVLHHVLRVVQVCGGQQKCEQRRRETGSR